jgi:hypothetical protein
MNAGEVLCFGSGGPSADGYGNGRTPIAIPGVPAGLKSLASSSSAGTCGVTASGGLSCWSDGRGARPVTVPGLPPIASLTFGPNPAAGVPGLESNGTSHACAVTLAGGAKCWGGGRAGELGNGTTSGSGAAVDVKGLTSGVAAVDAGSSFTCALTTSGGVKCWGHGFYGILGNGTIPTKQATPVDVTGLSSGVTQVVASGYYHACALLATGRIKCWGWNTAGQLGHGDKRMRYSRPVDVVFARRR